ncbi:MAG: DUF3037 domain-containing protein [Nitrosopumilus sp. B06]|nr:MAG: DUF3037 domain-containing protein [Nitrosopumilus sp. B06]
MNTYSYAVARFIPDAARNEPVNVGIILNDSDKKRAYGKFIENFRTMHRRYPKSDIDALRIILDMYKGEHEIQSKNFMSNLNKDDRHQLIFTDARAIKSETPQKAIQSLYELYISVEPKENKSRRFTQARLKSEVAQFIIKSNLEKKWIKPRFSVGGPIDNFKFHYAFKNGHVSDLLHVISFASDPKGSLTRAKALALTVEYVTDTYSDISPAVLVHPPKYDKHIKEFYDPAIRYLEDKKCVIKSREQIPKYIMNIKQKFSKRSATLAN